MHRMGLNSRAGMTVLFYKVRNMSIAAKDSLDGAKKKRRSEASSLRYVAAARTSGIGCDVYLLCEGLPLDSAHI